eukprot:scaffold16006_cov35-Prasinocladus_malaysianus.AAC.3
MRDSDRCQVSRQPGHPPPGHIFRILWRNAVWVAVWEQIAFKELLDVLITIAADIYSPPALRDLDGTYRVIYA